ncbi:MAG: redoxin domain-containing protein [Theionarchaea archaeon]|nr:redoxin domain-containing protein [Theionarchaea archaeon]
MTEEEIIKRGDKAPDFALKDHKGEVRLSNLKGKKVLLSFHPLAWTSVCAEQMKSLERNEQAFERLNTVALGVSVDRYRRDCDNSGREIRLLIYLCVVYPGSPCYSCTSYCEVTTLHKSSIFL